MALLQTSFTTQLLLLFSIVFLFTTPIAIAFTKPTTPPYDNDSELNRENVTEIQNLTNMTSSPLIQHGPEFDIVGQIRKKRFVLDVLGSVSSVLTIFDFIFNKITGSGDVHAELQKITSQLNSVKDQIDNTIKEIKIDGMNTRISPHEAQIRNSLRAADDYLKYKTENRKKMFLNGFERLEESIFNIFEQLTNPSVIERLSILEQLKQYYDVSYTNLKFSYIKC